MDGLQFQIRSVQYYVYCTMRGYATGRNKFLWLMAFDFSRSIIKNYLGPDSWVLQYIVKGRIVISSAEILPETTKITKYFA